MNVSHAWLKEFVDHPLDALQLRDLITERCATVDAVEPLRSDLAGIVVARVVEAGRHPDSDHLSVTKVDAGGGELVDVVCGAPNVTAGKLYPFAPVGTVMPGGLKIEKRRIRGATSQGMLCSARELGLGESHEGILELDLEVAPGTPLLQAMPIGDARLVIDVTPNRPDLLSHVGVAREIAAAPGRPLRSGMPDGVDASGTPPAVRVMATGQAGPVSVTVEDTEGCPRYLGVVISGVTIGPSPEWLAHRLQAVGSRSVNNIVDVTNFMLHGYGQPMHAFDASRLEGNAVVVRRARAGEKLVTLDGVERSLEPSMTVIADGARAIALAGVMGGRDTEVGPGTTSIFLEVASFDPSRTRAMRRRLGLSTDASYRFERGVDADAAAERLAQAAALIISVAGGTIEGAPVDVHSAALAPRGVTLRTERVRRLLGEAIPAAEILALLRSVGFGAVISPGTEMLVGSEELRVTVPGWRPDVSIEADLIEDVARLRGFGTFSSSLRPFRLGTVPDAPLWQVANRLRALLAAEGFFEARPMPFTAGDDNGAFVSVSNPIAENEGHLRSSLLDSLARRAEYNLARMQGDVRLFEIGAAWEPRPGSALPRETMRVAALMMGSRRPPHFSEPRVPRFDEWDAKALGELVATAAFPDVQVDLRPAGTDGLLWEIVRADGGADPGTRANGAGAAALGQIRRVVLDAPVWAAPAFGVELTLEEIESAPLAASGQSASLRDGGQARGEAGDHSGDSTSHVRMTASVAAARALRVAPIPATPAVEVDVALLVPVGVTAGRVESVIRAQAGELLEGLMLFDQYEGAGVPAGHRSLAWRLTFRHPERTLRDKEIEGRRSKLLRALESELGIRPRTS